jgi:hypothetical protein
MLKNSSSRAEPARLGPHSSSRLELRAARYTLWATRPSLGVERVQRQRVTPGTKKLNTESCVFGVTLDCVPFVAESATMVEGVLG